MRLSRRMFFVGVCLFGLSLPLSIAGANMAWVLLLLGFLIDAGARRALFVRCRADALLLPWLAYLAVSAASALAGLRPQVSLTSLARWDCTHALVYFLLIGAIAEDSIPGAIQCYLAGAVAAAALGVLQVVYAYRATGQVMARLSAHGTVYHITYGELMSFALGLCLCLFLFAKGRREKLVAAAALALADIGLILSQARGAWLATGFVLLVCAAAYPPGRRKVAGFVLIHLLLLAGVFLAASRVRFAASYAGRISSIFSLKFASNRAHVEMWETGLRMFRDHPLWGLGPANVRLVFAGYHPASMGGEVEWGNLHNLYIHQLAERGILGLASLLWLLAAMFRLVLRAFRAGPSALRLWALAMFPAFLAMNLTETSFQHAIVAFTLVWSLALAQVPPTEKLLYLR